MLDSINFQKAVLDLLNKYSNTISRVGRGRGHFPSEAGDTFQAFHFSTRGKCPLRRGESVPYRSNKYSNVISRLEAEILLCCLFNCEKVDLYVKDFEVDEDVERQYDALVNQRINGEPIQYITGYVEFMGFRFIVNKDVFIPRPETELLVSEILRTTHDAQRTTILDIGTGCGNIAISLARLMPQAEIVATDISEPALKVSQKNAILHKVAENITFYKGDLFKALPKEVKFDIILCNPPYIKRTDLEFLQKEIKCEPKIALDGGDDGLDFYRQIASQAPNYLKRDGVLLLEIGFGQAKLVKDIFSSTNKFEMCSVIEDFAGIERVICFRV